MPTPLPTNEPDAAPNGEVLSVERLSKVYGDTTAVDGVSFRVRRGEIVGLVGPNGAGKSTTINMIMGVLEPTAGSIRVDGVSVATHRSRALQRTNFAAVYAALPGNLTVYYRPRANQGLFLPLSAVKALRRELCVKLEQTPARQTATPRRASPKLFRQSPRREYPPAAHRKQVLPNQETVPREDMSSFFAFNLPIRISTVTEGESLSFRFRIPSAVHKYTHASSGVANPLATRTPSLP